jgi:hypothetical protein
MGRCIPPGCVAKAPCRTGAATPGNCELIFSEPLSISDKLLSLYPYRTRFRICDHFILD